MFSQSLEEFIIWMLIVGLVVAIPVTLYYFGILQKRNTDSIQSKLHRPKPIPKLITTKVKLESNLDFNFSNNWTNTNSSTKGNLGSNLENHTNADDEQKVSKQILKTVAINGEMGMQVQQISDILKRHNIEINYSLNYLVDKNFIESVNSLKGDIYYLSELGTRYCYKKGYFNETA